MHVRPTNAKYCRRPEGHVLWGQFSALVPSSPWRLDCGWVRNRLSSNAAGGVWTTFAAASGDRSHFRFRHLWCVRKRLRDAACRGRSRRCRWSWRRLSEQRDKFKTRSTSNSGHEINLHCKLLFATYGRYFPDPMTVRIPNSLGWCRVAVAGNKRCDVTYCADYYLEKKWWNVSAFKPQIARITDIYVWDQTSCIALCVNE